MVVACRTQQFIKSSKNMTISKNISFSTSSFPFVNRNFFNYTKNVPSIISKNETLVRLCCACRRFHSTDYFQTPRESRAGLTPQEILLVSANSVFSLDISEHLERVQRAILSKNPITELNNIIAKDLSRSNVQSYVESLVPESIGNLQRSSPNEDLLEGLIRSYATDPRIRRAASNSDTQSILDVLNYEIGGSVLVISNNSIVADIDAIERLMLNRTSSYIRRLYPNNFVAQVVANSFSQQQVRLLSADLRSILGNEIISVELVNEVTSLMRNSRRQKRDIVADLILSILRPQIAAVLVPIYTEFNTIVNTLLNAILSWYIPTAQDNALALVIDITNPIIIKVAEIIVVVQANVNSVFANLINGTVITTARRRRDIDSEVQNIYSNINNLPLEMPHRRVTRDLSSVFLLFTGTLNLVIKKIFITILSSQYVIIGSIVTVPIRVVFNTLIDSIFACSPCSSIV